MLQTKTSPSTGRTTNDDGLGILRIILKYPWVFGILFGLVAMGYVAYNLQIKRGGKIIPTTKITVEDRYGYKASLRFEGVHNCEEVVTSKTWRNMIDMETAETVDCEFFKQTIFCWVAFLKIHHVGTTSTLKMEYKTEFYEDSLKQVRDAWEAYQQKCGDEQSFDDFLKELRYYHY